MMQWDTMQCRESRGADLQNDMRIRSDSFRFNAFLKVSLREHHGPSEPKRVVYVQPEDCRTY